MSVSDWIYRNAKLNPNKHFLFFGEYTLSFHQFNKRVNSLVNSLISLKINRPDRIAIMADGCPQYIELYGAAAKGGYILTPINTMSTKPDLIHFIEDSKAKVIVCQSRYADLIRSCLVELKRDLFLICIDGTQKDFSSYEELISNSAYDEPQVKIDENDIMFLSYTSGTTGLPKGIMITHKNIFTNVTSNVVAFEYHKKTVSLNAIPPFFSGGIFCITMPMIYLGCSIVILEKFNAEMVIKSIQKHKVTHTILVPSAVLRLLEFPDIDRYDMGSLQTFGYGGSPMPLKVLEKAVSKFGNIFVQGYGVAEAVSNVTVLEKEDHIDDRRRTSCGRENLNNSVRVVNEYGKNVMPGEVGEIVVKGDNVMKGYWNLPSKTAEVIKDGWLYTGDLAMVDNEEYIYIVDRKKDMIVSGGENVYPKEVEDVLYKHPAVAEAAVIGIPDDRWGEAVKAIIVSKSDIQLTDDEIIEFCNENLAAYKRPKSVDIVHELPKNPAGKILKKELKEKYCKGKHRMVS